MAHDAQNIFFRMVKDEFPRHFKWVNVCEIGSLDINGTIRTLFEYANYVGFDVALGPAVDYAVFGKDVKYPSESFDITVSSECFEHDSTWRETFENMLRMTKYDGLTVFTCAGTDRPEHGTSRTDAGSSPLTVGLGIEYYKNLAPEDFEDIDLEDFTYFFYENTVNKDLYFVGYKNTNKESINRLKALEEKVAAVEWK